MTDDPGVAAQIGSVLRLAQASLGANLAGAYLYGSAVIGGLKPASDLDMFAIVRERTSPEQRRSLIDGLLPLSSRAVRPSEWHPVELTIVVQSEVRPWRYPPRMDFQSGEWLRAEFDAGSLGNQDAENPDLALLISQVLLADKPQFGPQPSLLLDAPPREDLVRAMLDGIEHLLADIDSDTANVLLTLARMWNTIATESFRPKDEAADWALERLPPGYGGALEHARRVYLGQALDRWDDPTTARIDADHLVDQIRAEGGRTA